MNYLVAPESVSERQAVYLQLLEVIGPESKLEIFSDFRDFSSRLRRFNNPEIIVMLAVEINDIPNIFSLADLIRDAALIILLTDDNQATVNAAIRLRPKFIGSMENDMENIVPIVEKLIQIRIARQKMYSPDNEA